MPRTATASTANLHVAGPSTSKPIMESKLRHDAGDVSDTSEKTSSITSGNPGGSIAENEKYPENIHKCINALRNLHMEARRKEVESQVAAFRLEADTYRSLDKVWKKRAEFIAGKAVPTEQESKFSLTDKDIKPDTSPDDGQKGIPKFWMVVLNYAAHTADMIQPHDIAVLEFLKDVRIEYKDKPLGFGIAFEFAPNPFFGNTVLTRSYEYDTNLTPTQLYTSNGLMPTSTAGCKITWKEGKDVTKKSASGDGMKGSKKVDSFFDFFTPGITDLSKIGQMLAEEDSEDLMEKAEQAGVDYEIATGLRLRVVPRALLFYTGEADAEGVDDSDFSEDYSYAGDTDEESGRKQQDDSEAEDNQE
ncbi:nucleosome assembly protein 1-like 1-A [Paramacrobiotus metropolitanus]|uniref:nucleosome assembly protein 1-like 1-A n=1 Tax=Paramacrobiotus metropolitanus TaxID=2943436 RepID=UPI002445E46B|nr:nucleosome assembly protein 1-like 1-A [Paramacrobiotus metropolitanus]XP_055351644.1 nucleosome assembly protein 1-like 1-A [Paramacrobiotus metropolitanus]